MKSVKLERVASVVISGVLAAGCSSVSGDPQELSCTDPVASCSQVGVDFGTLLAPCGEIPCGKLRFEKVEVAAPGAERKFAMVATPTGLVVAFITGDGLTVAREQADGSFLPEAVDPDADLFNSQGLGADAQGRIWLAYVSSGRIKVASSTAGGGYEIFDGPSGVSEGPALAVDAAGVAHLVYRDTEYSAESSNFSLHVVRHVTVSGAGVVEQSVEALDSLSEQGPTIGLPSVAIDAAGGVHVLYVWRLGTGLLRHARQVGDTFTVEQVGAAGGLYNAGQLSAVFGGDGRLHVLYPDSPFNLHYAVLSPGGWEVSTVANTHSNRENALAVDSEGGVHVAFHNADSLLYGVGRGSWWPSQVIAACDEGDVRMVFDHQGQLRIAQTCEGLFVMGIAGAYPADYLQTCADVSAAICTAACQCAGDNSCRTITSTGNFGASPASYCPQNMNSRICGDATRDPAPLYACAAALGPFECATTSSGGSGAMLAGTTCGELFSP